MAGTLTSAYWRCFLTQEALADELDGSLGSWDGLPVSRETPRGKLLEWLDTPAARDALLRSAEAAARGQVLPPSLRDV